MKRSTTIACLVSVALFAASPALAGDPTCGRAVIVDWADGSIDGRYAPRCYGDAIEALPEDVRAYTTAADDIAQALRARIRETRTRESSARAAPPVRGPSAPVPLPLVSGAAIALALALAVGARIAVRRLRRARLAHRSTRPVSQW